MVKEGEQKKFYFSDKLKKKLALISSHPLTIVEAPLGFGKTTAVKEYLKENLPQEACQHWYTCLGEPLPLAWKSICNLIAGLYGELEDSLKNIKDYTFETLLYMMQYPKAFQCRAKTYLIVDNYQLMNCKGAYDLLNSFSRHGDPNLHLIFITQPLGDERQNPIYNPNINRIGAASFLFDREDTANLFRMEGLSLTDRELESMHKRTMGWIAAIRLYLINFRETGSFNQTADVEKLIEAAIWNGLTNEEKKLLLAVSILDNFTVQQAAIMLGRETLPEGVAEGLKANNFVQYSPDKQRYSVHGILRNYLRGRFYYHKSKNYQNLMFYRAGQACAANSQYYLAARFFFYLKDFNSILSLPLGCQLQHHQEEMPQPDFIRALIDECPEEILYKYPFSMIALGHQALLCGGVKEYQKLCELLDLFIRDKKNFGRREFRKIKGEYAFLKAMGSFNCIREMKKRQAEAWEILSEPFHGMNLAVPWMYGTTSVLDMFWRESGKLEEELEQMDEMSSLYYQLTRGHGAGAHSLMRGEAMLMRGEDDEAERLCYQALYDARSYQQICICICAELVFARIAILRGDVKGYFKAADSIRGYAKESPDIHISRMIDQCMAKIGIILGIEDYTALWLCNMEGVKKALHAPIVPHAQTIYLKRLLTERKYNEFYGISQLILDVDKTEKGNIVYLMPRIYHFKLLAIAKLSCGQYFEAREYLNQALAIALPDKVYLPVAQQAGALSSLFELAKGSCLDKEGLNALIALGKRQEKGVRAIRKAILSGGSPLTPREKEIALLAKNRLSAKEIADTLYISDATVRTILKSVYRKLDIHSKYELTLKEF